MKKTWLVVASGVALVAGFASVNAAGAHTRSGKATLSGPDGTEIGTVKITTERGHTEVKVRLQGAPGADAFHGFHIHANDVPGNGEGCVADPAALSSTWFVSADGHYNPTGKAHAHHVGDMPVVYVNADGSVETVFQIDPIKPNDLDGKVVVLHAGADNYANVPLGDAANQYTANSAEATATTGRTGNAGDRVACGVIRTG